MQKIIALGVVALFLAAAVPSAEAGTRPESHSYIPGIPFIPIWCSGEAHSLVPKGSDPFNYDEDPVWSAYGWSFSGEPECAPQDALNAAREAQGQERTSGGYGGAAFTILENELGGVLGANTDDDFFGVGQSYIVLTAYRQEDASGNYQSPESQEGCGPQALTIPTDIETHWQSDLENPMYILWAEILPAMVDADLGVCFSSTGIIDGKITS